MKKKSKNSKAGLLALAVAFVGCNFAAIFPSCETTLTTLNPCGSVLGFCNAIDIDRLFGDIPDFELDPSCSIPFFGLDPDQGGGGGGGQNVGTCSTVPIFPFTPGPRP